MSTTLAGRVGLQPRQSLAAAGIAAKNWELVLNKTIPQQRLVKTGGRLVRHARYYWLLLAEGRLSRRLFGSMLRMVAALPLPDG
jgi:hypothetical protein